MTARIALVGAGEWGRHLLRNFHALDAAAAICDANAGRLAHWSAQFPALRAYEAYSDVLRDDSIHAVALATPSESHADLVRRALLAGKDVFVEKPLCLSLAEGEELVRLARARRRVLMVGHLLWYHPAIQALKQLMDQGELGRVQYVYSNRLNLGKIRREENILWSFAPHDISVILGLLGQMPETVQAQGGNYLHDKIADVTVSLLSFPSGAKAHIFVSWLHPFKEQKLVVVGERRMAVFDDLEKKAKLVLYPHGVEWQNNVPVVHKAEAHAVEIEPTEPLLNECRHFLECIGTRAQPRTDGEESLRVLRVLEQCQRSLEPQRVAGTRPGIHPSAFIEGDVEIGTGTSIWHVSHVLTGSKIGKDCKIGQNVVIGPEAVVGDRVKIQNNVSVYKGVTLEDDVFCGPAVVFTNVLNPRSEIPRMDQSKPTRIRQGATLGANSTILCGVTIGRYAFVGAGAVVTKDVHDYALVVGNPARQAGWICICAVKLEKKGAMWRCPACDRRYAERKARLTLLQTPVRTHRSS
jgi:UDP-2-acetamido-3-amino-2,3-dideoxy-glucuronate N-acetyltransferase